MDIYKNKGGSYDDTLLYDLEKYGISEVTITSETDTSKTAHVSFPDGTTNNIIVSQDQDVTTYEISQGPLTDIIEVNNNSEVFLNGKSIGSRSTAVEPQAINQPFQQMSCPFGEPYHYSNQAGKEEKGNIKLDKAIRNYTLIALSAIVLYHAGPLLTTAVGGGGTAVGTSFFSAWLSDAKNSAPDSQALSYKLTFYHHKDYPNGAIPSALMYVRRNVITYYPKANFAGDYWIHMSYSGTIL